MTENVDKKQDEWSSVDEVYQFYKSDSTKQLINFSSNTGTFLLSMGVMVPMFLTITPLSITYQIGLSLLKKKPSQEKVSLSSSIKPAEDRILDLNSRKYDLVLLGATGFTGGLAAEYIAEQYGLNDSSGGLRWAIAGRNQKKLDAVKKRIASKLQLKEEDVMNKIDTIIVDTSQSESLPGLVKEAKVVASTAGPFYAYGSPVVEFCAMYGTNYVDITGEVDWSQDMIAQYDDLARETGAKIVSFCGHDSVPWDLSAHKLREILEANGDSLEKVEFFNENKGEASGGTIATALMAVDRLTSGDKVRYEYDPLLKNLAGKKSSVKTKKQNVMVPEKCSNGVFSGRWLAPFIMADINGAVVTRSNVLHDSLPKTSNKVLYRESMTVLDLENSIVGTLFLSLFTVALLNPLTNAVVKKIVPKQGEGPSSKTMEKSFLYISGVATGSNGTKAESAMYIPKCAGYYYTSRMLIESALSLALEYDNLPLKNGGFLTPATAMGDVLLKRLSKTGIKFGCQMRSKL